MFSKIVLNSLLLVINKIKSFINHIKLSEMGVNYE